MSGPDYYGPSAGYVPPPGQGYDGPPSAAGNGYDSQDYQNYATSPPPQHTSHDLHSGHPIPPGYVPPHQPPSSSYDPHNFPPPPREEYRDYDYDDGPPPPSGNGRGYDKAPRSEYGAPPSNYDSERPYAPSDPRPNEGNAVAPYDEEKAEAEWRRGYDEDRRYNAAPPPPPSDYDSRWGDRRRDDRERRGHDDRWDDRRYDDRRYDDETDRRSYYDYDDRRRDSDQRRDGRYREPRSPTKGGKDVFGGKEGERGLGAQILGGAAGGLVGHEMGGGILETLGGVVVGAVGAKVLENQLETRKNKKEGARMGGKTDEAAYKGEALSRKRTESSTHSSSRPPQRDDYSRRGGMNRRSRSYSYSDEDSRSPPRRR